MSRNDCMPQPPVPREDDRPAEAPVKLPGQPHAPERVAGRVGAIRA